TTADPLLGLAATPWTPPGDRRALGVGVLAIEADAPQARLWAILSAAAFVAAVTVLVAAAVWATGSPIAPLVAGLGVLAFAGPLLAYGDPWLNTIAPWALAGSLLVAAIVWRGRRIAGQNTQHATRNTQYAIIALAAGLLLYTLMRFNTG